MLRPPARPWRSRADCGCRRAREYRGVLTGNEQGPHLVWGRSHFANLFERRIGDILRQVHTRGLTAPPGPGHNRRADLGVDEAQNTRTQKHGQEKEHPPHGLHGAGEALGGSRRELLLGRLRQRLPDGAGQVARHKVAVRQLVNKCRTSDTPNPKPNRPHPSSGAWKMLNETSTGSKTWLKSSNSPRNSTPLSRHMSEALLRMSLFLSTRRLLFITRTGAGVTRTKHRAGLRVEACDRRHHREGVAHAVQERRERRDTRHVNKE